MSIPTQRPVARVHTASAPAPAPAAGVVTPAVRDARRSGPAKLGIASGLLFGLGCLMLAIASAFGPHDDAERVEHALRNVTGDPTAQLIQLMAELGVIALSVGLIGLAAAALWALVRKAVPTVG
jgi:hypothetical protein